MRTLRIGSRGSALAKWQAQHIAARLAKLGAATEIFYIKTSGDRAPQAGISQFGVKGVFIKEIEDALLDGRIDLAVHSLKDVPTEMPISLVFPSICEREDPRDALISANGAKLEKLETGSRVGTSSLRRQAQLRRARPDLEFIEMRGNVDTRLRKLDEGEYDAIVLAKAGLDRLGLGERITEILSPDVCLPAVGQGALAIEACVAKEDLLALLAQLDHAPTRAAVTAERALLREVEGGCQIPLGAWARVEGGVLVLDARIVSLDGEDCVRKQVSGPVTDPDGLGVRAARELLAAGAGRILRSARRESPAMESGFAEGQPLAGLRIVVTRAPEQSRDLTQRLSNLGANVISLPAIAFEDPHDLQPLDAAIQQLASFDWLLFTSSNAARFFARRCRALGFEISALRNRERPLFVAAVGPATSEAAAAEGFVVGHMAEEFRSAELARELNDQLRGRSVLLPRSDLAAPDLAEALRNAGAEVTEVVAYRTVPTSTAAPEALELARRGDVDVICFFSASAFHHLADRIGDAAMRHITIAAVGPVTASAIRAAGLPVAVEARQATGAAFVQALVRYFSRIPKEGVRTP